MIADLHKFIETLHTKGKEAAARRMRCRSQLTQNPQLVKPPIEMVWNWGEKGKMPPLPLIS